MGFRCYTCCAVAIAADCKCIRDYIDLRNCVVLDRFRKFFTVSLLQHIVSNRNCLLGFFRNGYFVGINEAGMKGNAVYLLC